MRIAVLSDIHSNLAALEAVQNDLPAIDEVWALGDIVGYGPQPNEVIRSLQAMGARSVLGNHDGAAIGTVDPRDFNPEAAKAIAWTATVIDDNSRAYLATPTGLKLFTSDHSTVGRLIQLGQLDPSEAREHPLRSQLYRTIGQQPEVAVDFIYQPIGDATHLLLGSDGLWGMLGDDVLLDVLEHTIWPQDACHELIARANLAGGDDNITAIVVTLPTQP